jgi:hypothetical protein
MTPPKAETNLLELMRADRLAQNKRQAEQGAVDREAAREPLPAVRIERLEATAPRRSACATHEDLHRGRRIKARWRGRTEGAVFGSRSFHSRAARAKRCE